MSVPPAISAVELVRSFGGVRVVDRLSFTVTPGEIFGLVGPDGAGKTTTLRMLAGVLPPDAGTAVVVGCDIVQDPESVKHHISYMPQRFGLYEDLTVDENIRFYADLFGVPRVERETRAAQLLTMAGLADFRDRLAGDLSGGMKQKLGLVCALVHTPRVLLLDEPTTGVDPISRRDFWQILYGLVREGVAVLFSTAYLVEAERCHRVGLLHRGRLLACGAPTTLKQQLDGAVISIVGPEPRRLRTVLAPAEGVRSVVLVGDGLHLVVDNADQRLPELRVRLQQAGVVFETMEVIAPTMEDLFVAGVAAASGM